MPKPPEPTPKPATTVPPPCAPSPCANVARNSYRHDHPGHAQAAGGENGDRVVVTGVTEPSRGTAWISDGGYVVRYTPTRDYTGRRPGDRQRLGLPWRGTASTPVYITVS